MNLNQVTIAGNLTADPECRYLQNGTAAVKMQIALNYNYKKDDKWMKDTAFVSCLTYGKAADSVASARKGENIMGTGRLKTESWEKDGKKHQKLVVLLNDACIVPKTESAPDDSQQDAPAKPQSKPSHQQPVNNTQDDDVPF